MNRRSRNAAAMPQPLILRHPWPASGAPEAEALLREALAAGKVMVYPTETAYALGGNALLPAVIEAVYRLKGRAASKALPLLIDAGGGVKPWARDPSPQALRLMARFWPGPLTLVFRAGSGLPAALADGRGTVALRWSPHPLIAALLRLGGVPLIGTSANPSGSPPARTLPEVLAAFAGPDSPAIGLAIDGGSAPETSPSTLLDTTVSPLRVIRAGAVSMAELRAALPGEEFA